MTQLALVNERTVTVSALPAINGLPGAEAAVSGLPMRWQFIVTQTADGPQTFYAHSIPVDAGYAWSELLRMPAFRDHPVPTTQRQMHRFCRWFLAPKAAL